ncbi:MAG: class I SAM-dependent methyltransferase [Proteobacteria bacterium]|nr:class I SAM-dependent methyltransferase [Pseudomonadota bacterium]
MGDFNTYEFVRSNVEGCDGPVLEVGSRDYGNTYNFRPLLESHDYVGIDMSEGKGVDKVLDLTKPFDDIDKALDGKRFGTIICLSVLEHCDKPFLMAENMTRLLKPGGRIFISVPFSWKFHGYPSDYWRFTHEGVKKLFADLSFDNEYGYASTSRDNEKMPLDNYIGSIKMSGSSERKRGNFLRGLSIDAIKYLLWPLGIFYWMTKYRYLMMPTMINMIGVKK